MPNKCLNSSVYFSCISLNDVFICLSEQPEYYYLDQDGFYKRCFQKCLSCSGHGDEKDNNCTKCKPNYIFLNDSLYSHNCYEMCPYYYYYFNETNHYICSENKTCPENHNK